ncbi:MAG: serine protease [Anaeromyxobacteraceae bacterium]
MAGGRPRVREDVRKPSPRQRPPGRPLARLLAVVLAFLPAAALAANPRSSTVHRVFPSAVRVQVLAGGKVVRSASGIAFAREGERTAVLTNAHVVEPAPGGTAIEVRVLLEGREPVPARLLAAGQVEVNDLAVLEVSLPLPVTPLAPDEALELGDDLVVIGAPFGKGLSVAAGIVSQVEYELAENAAAPRRPRALKTDAAIGYGSSGGGVFDVPAGRLVGLVEGYRTARVAFGKDPDRYAFDVPMPGETFVAPAAKIRGFLRAQGLGRLAGDGPTGPAGGLAVPAATTGM